MKCCNCEYLNSNKKECGKVSGKLYYCENHNKFVNPSNNTCDSFNKCYSRKYYQNNEMYEDGKNYDNEPANLGQAITFLIIVIILSILSKILS